MTRSDLVSTIAQILEPWAWEIESWNATIARDDAMAKAEQILAALALPAPVVEGDLAWLGSDTRLSLEHYSPVYGDDDDQSREWRVHRESGSINDRIWDIVGRGSTPHEAIAAARAALSEGRSHG